MSNLPPAPVDLDLIDKDVLNQSNEMLLKLSLWLMRNESFFSVLYMRLNRVPVPGLGTMGVTMDTLYYDPHVMVEWSLNKLRFVILHEVLHVVLRHPLRRGHRDPDDTNKAQDYVINGLIVQAGEDKAKKTKVFDPAYVMPEDGLFDRIFLGMIWEDVYDLIHKDDEPQGNDDNTGDPQQGDSSGNKRKPGKPDWGEVFDQVNPDGSALTEEQKDKIEMDTRRLVMQAEQIAKQRGDMSDTMRQAIKELNEPTPVWQEVLREMMVDTIPSDYSFAKPNRMSMAMGSEIVMPTVEKYGLGHILFMNDESGSVTEPETVQFASDMRFIFDELEPEKITVIHFDTKANEPEEFEQGEDFRLVRQRLGGTNFASAFAKAEQCGIEPDICIVLTDGGDYHYPKEVPDYPVIWATTGKFMKYGPPFGEVLPIKLQPSF